MDILTTNTLMNPQDQIIAIATACGWTNIEMYYGTLQGGSLDYLYGTTPYGNPQIRVPNFLDSGPLQHALATLRTREEQEKFGRALYNIVFGGEQPISGVMVFQLVYQKPENIAEAFLRSKGLWHE